MTPVIVLLALGCVWVAAYFAAPLWMWTVAVLFAYGALAAAHMPAGVGIAVVGLLPALMLLLTLVPARRTLLTRLLFRRCRQRVAALPEATRIAVGAVASESPQWLDGHPDWQRLLATGSVALTDAEQAFVDGPCQLPEGLFARDAASSVPVWLEAPAWRYLCAQRFFALAVDRVHGGRGFSAAARSAVLARLADQGVALAVAVAAPDAPDVVDLLQRYGSEAQRRRWLPRLADGVEVPCFVPTGLCRGTDPDAIESTGVVAYGAFEGRQVLGLRIDFRGVAVVRAPLATLFGLAFHLTDPDGLLGDPQRREHGLTCALIPARHDGICADRAGGDDHLPLFGAVAGSDVFIPVEWIIGGPAMAGQGWHMLAAVGDGRDLWMPAMAVAAARTALGAVLEGQPPSADHRIRLRCARMLAWARALDALRVSTVAAETAPGRLGFAGSPLFRLMRRVLDDAMDVMAGGAVPGAMHTALPALSNAWMIGAATAAGGLPSGVGWRFARDVLRAHPHLLSALEALRLNDLAGFDRQIWRHAGVTLSRAVRAFTCGCGGTGLIRAPLRGPAARYVCRIDRMSAALCVAFDVGLVGFGVRFIEDDRLSGRLGEVAGWLAIGASVLGAFVDRGQVPEEMPLLCFVLDSIVAEAADGIDAYLRNLPRRHLSALLRLVLFPSGIPYRSVADATTAAVAAALPPDLRLWQPLLRPAAAPAAATTPEVSV